MRKLALVAALFAFASCLHAQRFGSPGVSGIHHHPGFGPGSAVFFADPFYSEALYREGYPAASQPPVIIMQSPPAAVADRAPAPAQPPTQPLMIELQGDHYVRVSGEESSTAEILAPQKTIRTQIRSAKAINPAARSEANQQTAFAVLVFRDGRHQEVSDYTIVDGALYTQANYYTDGSWNKKIDLQSLNLPDTIAANQSRGIKFQLPTAPNEVIVRP